MDQAAERIESLKSGFMGAFAATIEMIVVSGIRLLAYLFHTNGSISVTLAQPEILSHPFSYTLSDLVIALLSGGLFGITYRYIVRADHNLQLQMGAVGAFGLVRGLAQVEASWALDPYWVTGLKLLASLLMFATAALLLDWSMQQGWIKRFGAS